MECDIIYKMLKYMSLKEKSKVACVSKQFNYQCKLYNKKYFITNLNYNYLKKIFIKWKRIIYKNKKLIINSWSPKHKPENTPILLF